MRISIELIKPQWTKRQKITGILLVGLFLFILLTAGSCWDTSAQSTTNATSSSSGGNLQCDKDDQGNPIQYKQACQQIIKRYKFLADANTYGYFYAFLQNNPNPVMEYVVQGGVFPVDDMVSNPEYQNSCGSNCGVVLPRQQPDGTYSTNGGAMFGWLADGTYFEWDGIYAFSSQPLSFTGQKIIGCKSGVPGC